MDSNRVMLQKNLKFQWIRTILGVSVLNQDRKAPLAQLAGAPLACVGHVWIPETIILTTSEVGMFSCLQTCLVLCVVFQECQYMGMFKKSPGM